MTAIQKDTLGIVLPDHGMYSYSEILQGAQAIAVPVSYTHLTLPTSDLV